MSGFRFRLQDLLRVRAWREQQSAQRAAAAHDAVREARDRRDTLDAVRSAGLQQVAHAHNAGAAAGHMQQLALIMEQFDEHIAEADTAAQDAQDEVHKRLDELASAAQARLVLDKLRERRHADWTSLQLQLDQQRMDEIAITRYQTPADAEGQP
jgi:flagellar protein FliJ